MNFEKDVPALKAEFGYWTTTIKRFISEGMPVVEPLPPDYPDNDTISGADSVNPLDKKLSDKNVRSACGLESYVAKFPCNFSPLLKERVLEETDEYKVYVDQYGITMKARKTGTSTPLDLEFPVKDRASFNKYKEYYDTDYSKRLPPNWNTLKVKLKNRDFPIRLGGFPYGFFGFPRHLMGAAELFMMMYDDPDLVKDINEFFLNFTFGYWEAILRDFSPDCVLIWEDMASKNGSLISKEMFEEFMSPYYVRMIDFLKQHGVRNIHVDSDGYVEDLLPLWDKLGVTGIFPFEVQAANDLIRIRRNYPRMQLLGGVDKRVFQVDKTKEDIEKELDRIKTVLKTGGFIPHADHHVPDDSCWKNFSYYRKRLNEIIDTI